MLYILQYLSIICAFLLPWGVLCSVQAKKNGDGRKLKIYGILAAVSIAVVGITVMLAFVLN